MAWLVIAVVLLLVWFIESTLGWLFGGQLRWLAVVGAFIYFRVFLNRLQAGQAELQTELKRLQAALRTAQASSDNVSSGNSERGLIQPDSAFEPAKATENVKPVSDAPIPEYGQFQFNQSSTENVMHIDNAISQENVPPSNLDKIQLTAKASRSTEDDFEETVRAPVFFEQWLAGGNWIVRAGLAILFIGLVFLAKFAYENDLLPIELRLAAIAGFGAALLVIGWRSGLERLNYGLSLQGGGVAVLYLTVFAMYKLTLLIPAIAAMLLLLVVATLAAWLAIQQNAMVLAVIGTVGGFMAPVLLSTGQGGHIGLFSYFAALNAGIITVALHKAWRPLNLLAFFFTFGIAGLWGMKHYQPEFLVSCLLFLSLFFAMFVGISILFTRHQTQEGDYRRAIDASLLFGVPTVVFGFASYLLSPFEYGAAWVAVILSAVYFVLVLFAHGHASITQLKTPWGSLSLVFATLAIPLAFDARLTSSIWALEGAAVISYGWRQGQPKGRLFGYVLVFLGSYGFITQWPDVTDSLPVFNALTLGLLVLCLAYGVIGMTTNRYGKSTVRADNPDSNEALRVSWIMALALAFTGALVIMTELYSRNSSTMAGIAAPALLWLWALALQRFGGYAQWPQTSAPAIVLPVFSLLLPMNNVWDQDNLTTQALLLTALGLFALLAWQAVALKRLLPDLWGHYRESRIMASILVLPGFTLVAYWWLILERWRNTGSSLIFESELTMQGWFTPLAAVLPIMLLWWLAQANCPKQWQWLHGDGEMPAVSLAKQRKGFALVALLFVIATALFHSGYGEDTVYIPVMNGYESVAIAAMLALFRVFANTGIAENYTVEQRRRILGGLGFFFVNSILSRILTNYYGAEFDLGFAWRSAIAATSYSIVWTLAALMAMWLASRRSKRGLWIFGAALLAVVAVKLIFVDLSNVGSLARIVSFIGVGVLMLVVGYVAPLPAGHINKTSV